jgi:hypothetical protein
LAKQMGTSAPDLLLPSPRVELPAGYELLQNHPNPFNPSTTIRYQLPGAAQVRLVVFDIAGRVISVLVDDLRQPGVHFSTWLANDALGQPLPSGVYFYRITAGRFSATRKMMLVR